MKLLLIPTERTSINLCNSSKSTPFLSGASTSIVSQFLQTSVKRWSISCSSLGEQVHAWQMNDTLHLDPSPMMGHYSSCVGAEGKQDMHIVASLILPNMFKHQNFPPDSSTSGGSFSKPPWRSLRYGRYSAATL